MRHSLQQHPLPGIDAARMERLASAGLASLEDVVSAGPERLASLTGFDEKTCVALVRLAQSSLVRSTPGVIAFHAPSPEGPMERLARGLEAARGLERVLSLVRKSRSHVGRAAPKAKWEKPHRRARKQLQRLAVVLEVIQQELLSEGLSEGSHQHLVEMLSPLDASLRSVLDAPVNRRNLKRAARIAKRARKAILTAGRAGAA